MSEKTSLTMLQWYDNRPQRERVALLVCVAVVIIFLMNLLVLQPASKRRDSAANELKNLQTSVADLKSQKLLIEARQGSDPDKENRQRLEVLKEQSETLRQQLKTNIVNLVSPHEMPELLKNLLTQQNKLLLLSLENLKPERLDLGQNPSENTALPTLYRHRLKMEFSGDYLTLLTYLRQLERLPRSMIWEEVEVETHKYPKATVRLQVYTLSLTEGWIGG
jgi:MSHA biogenesis protein MshJ